MHATAESGVGVGPAEHYTRTTGRAYKLVNDRTGVAQRTTNIAA